MKIKEWYRRSLPHWQPESGIFNICFRLANTLPRSAIEELRLEREYEKNKILKERPHLSETELKIELGKLEQLYFGKYDELLDGNAPKIVHLQNPEIAKVVSASIMHWHNKKYKVIAYCIMPNHVHLMVSDCKEQLWKILQSVKKFSGRKANIILNQQGTPFWHRESYDNLIRGKKDMERKLRYILNNPVKARLVKDWRKWEYTFLNDEYTWTNVMPIS